MLFIILFNAAKIFCFKVKIRYPTSLLVNIYQSVVTFVPLRETVKYDTYDLWWKYERKESYTQNCASGYPRGGGAGIILGEGWGGKVLRLHS